MRRYYIILSVDLIDKYFNISLNQPHIINNDLPLKPLNSFEENILEIAKNLQSDTGTFFFSQLINFLISDMEDEIKEKIIANIYDLKQRGFFKSIDF